MTVRSRILTFLLLLFTIAAASAQPVPRSEALQRAREFLRPEGRDVSDEMLTPRRSVKGQTRDLMHVFNTADGRGFIIVSGDERTDHAILGYSPDGGSFDPDHLNPAFTWWMEATEADIAALQGPQVRTETKRTPVGPLVKTQWNQGKATAEGQYYNTTCPTISGKHCLTGCVATAMAQIMYYHHWPQNYTKEVPGYTKEGMTLDMSDALPPVYFNFNFMTTTYSYTSTAQQVQAVSTLMRYCGQAAEMNYGLDVSLASTWTGAKNMVECFNYNPNTWSCLARSEFEKEEWEDIMYRELIEGRPVLYSGQKASGGHAFILDGYNAAGLWHFNWGWGGYQDGFFSMASANGYGRDQDAVIGLQRPTSGTTGTPKYEVTRIDITPAIVTTVKLSITNTGADAGLYSRFNFQILDMNSWETKYDDWSDLMRLKAGESYDFEFTVPAGSVGTNCYFSASELCMKGWGEWGDLYAKTFKVQDICNLSLETLDVSAFPTTVCKATVHNAGSAALKGSLVLTLSKLNKASGTYAECDRFEQKITASNLGPYKVEHAFEGMDVGATYRIDLDAVATDGQVQRLGSQTFTVSNYIYTLTYLLDGLVYKTFEIEQGTPITPEPAPSRAGYTFDGWQGLPDVMPGHDVTVTGSFTKIPQKTNVKVSADGYATFYDSQTDYILPHGLKASVVTGIAGGRLTYSVVADGDGADNIVPASLPVMLEAQEKRTATFTLTEEVNSALVDDYYGENLLCGSDEATLTSAPAASSGYLFYKLTYGASGTYQQKVFGWYWGAEGGVPFDIGGHRAWLALPRSAARTLNFLPLPDDATGISLPTTSQEGVSSSSWEKGQGRSEAYDLQGRRVSPASTELRHGIYIINGRKVAK